MLSSIPYNPVSFSYAVVTPTEAILYIDSSKLSDEVKKHLSPQVTVKPYESIFGDITSMSASTSAEAKETENSKWLVSNRASWALVEALGGQDKVEIARSPIEDAKAIKNERELEGMRACHVRDGAALTEYFAWLEDELAKGVQMDEVDAANKLECFRKSVAMFAETYYRHFTDLLKEQNSISKVFLLLLYPPLDQTQL